jgi:4-amino-4-deoxy-L-arabinose transferase-like glycosyltransferase
MQHAKPLTNPLTTDNTGTQSATTQTTAIWQRIMLALILCLSGFLGFFHLGQNDFADITTSVNSYYAAAVKSMTMNWHNFFFAAFDPHGFLAIDKPPLGFWFQVVSVRIFGFSEWSLLLPEVLAGIGAVAVLYILVRRTFGPNAGLIAALALALTPISVITSRNNTIDSLLILIVLCATWTLCLAMETGRLRWLLLTALLIGLGFNVKMLEAYLVLPAFVLTYLLGAPQRLRVRCLHLLLAGVILVGISLSWITTVDLIPATARPIVSSTQHDSELELALGYNGLNRAFGIGSNSNATSNASQNTTNLLLIFGIANTGIPGPLRLLDPQLGGQIGWLLLFALFSLVAVWRWKLPRQSLTPRQQGLVLWGGWFLTMLIFFSLAFFDHPYYMVMFSPAICALVGIGGVAMYQDYRARKSWRSWLLPIALIATAVVQAVIIASYPIWNQHLTPIIIGLSILVAGLLLVARFMPRLSHTILIKPIVTVGLLILLIAPTIWAAVPLWSGTDTINPVAGPPQKVNLLTIIAHVFIPESAHAQPALTRYLLTHQGQTPYLAVTLNASTAAPFILDTGKPVMALGGFNGFDQTLTAQQIATLVKQREVRFFLLPSLASLQLNQFSPRVRQEITYILQSQVERGNHGMSIIQPAITQWVQTHCTVVPRNAVEPGTSGAPDTVDLGEGYTFPAQLFDCPA